MTKTANYTREIIATSGQGYTTHERMNANGDIRFWLGREGHQEIYDYVITTDKSGTEIHEILDREVRTAKLVAWANGEYVCRAQILCVEALEGRLEPDDTVFTFYGGWAQ